MTDTVCPTCGGSGKEGPFEIPIWSHEFWRPNKGHVYANKAGKIMDCTGMVVMAFFVWPFFLAESIWYQFVYWIGWGDSCPTCNGKGTIPANQTPDALFPRCGKLRGIQEKSASFYGFYPNNIPPVVYRYGSLPVRMSNGTVKRAITSVQKTNDIRWWSKQLPNGKWVTLSYWTKPSKGRV